MARPSIVRDYGSEVLRVGSTLARGFILTPVLIASLGDQGYGLWKFIESVMIYIAFLEPCVRGTLSRYLAVSIGRSDRVDAARVVASSAATFLSMVAVIAVATVVLAPSIVATSRPDDVELFAAGVLALRLLAIASLLAACGGFAAAILQALRRFDLANAVGIPLMWAGLVAGLVVLRMGGGIVEFAWVIAGQSAMSCLVHGWLALRTCRSEGVIDGDALRPRWMVDLVNFALKSAVARIGDLLRTNSTTIIIGILVSLEAAAMFGAVDTLRRIALQVVVGLADTAAPRMAHSLSDEADFQHKLNSMLRSLSLIAVLVGGGMAVFGPDFLRLWLGEIVGDPTVIVGLLALMLFANGPRMAILRPLRVRNRVGIVAGSAVAEGVLVVVLGVSLAPEFGVVGVVASRVGVSVAFAFLLLPVLFGRIAGIPLLRFYRDGIVRPIVAIASPVAASLWLCSVVTLDTWGGFLLAAIPGAVLMIAGIFFVGLDAGFRSEIFERFSRRFS